MSYPPPTHTQLLQNFANAIGLRLPLSGQYRTNTSRTDDNNHKGRLEYFDFIRGLAILFVIGIHAHINPYNNEGVAVIIIRQIIGIAVPVFIALSGYFTTKTLNQEKNSCKHWSFVKKHIKKLYIPTVIWSVPVFVISLYNDQSTYLFDVLMLLCGGFSIYYFVTLLIQFYLLAPFLRKTNTTLLLISIIISLAVVFCETYVFPSWNNLPLIVSHGIFPGYLMFYVLGAYYANGKVAISSKPLLYVLCVICLILSVIESYYKLSHNYSSPMGVKASGYLLSLFVCMIVFTPSVKEKYKSNSTFRIISFLGFISLSIYLIHGYVITAVAKISDIAQSWMLSFVVTLAVTYFIYLFLKLIIPNKYHSYIGIVDFTKNPQYNESEEKL